MVDVKALIKSAVAMAAIVASVFMVKFVADYTNPMVLPTVLVLFVLFLIGGIFYDYFRFKHSHDALMQEKK